MRIVTLMLAMDRQNSERLRAIPVITYKPRAEATVRAALARSTAHHAARVATSVGVSPA